MNLIPNHLYKLDCTAANNGYFYGTYLRTTDTGSYLFVYCSSSEIIWTATTFSCSSHFTRNITHIGPPDEYPEYLI